MNPALLIYVLQATAGTHTVGGGGGTGSFSNEHSGEQSAPHTFVPFGEGDVSGLPRMSDERLERRIEGHVDLTSNHRTRHALMETMNDVFDEVFSLVITTFPETGMPNHNVSVLRGRLNLQVSWNGFFPWLEPSARCPPTSTSP